jgi:hypothetical protein
MKRAELNSPTLSTCNGKDTKYQNETQILFDYLQENTATATMVTNATGIVQKNICRYKRELEKLNLLWEVDYRPCKLTGFMAAWLTTNPNIVPPVKNKQLSLFMEGCENE